MWALRQEKGGYVHAFLVESGDELSLIDTLWNTDGSVVLQALSQLGRQPSELKRIAITHGHRSHLGGASALRRLTGAKIHAHPAEWDILAAKRRAKRVPITLRPPSLIKFRLGLALGIPKHAPFDVDEPLGDGDAFGPLEVVHAPGHSPGHLAFWWPERRALVAGDAIATWPKTEPGWPAFQLDAAAHERSLKRMASLEPLLVGVGHGEAITDGTPDRVHALAERARNV
jgi:glyoxylase-like metal-dependent hydrolase (beta-lactamase superfamily II)